MAETAEYEAREALSGATRVWARMGEPAKRRRSVALHALACFVPIAGPVYVLGRQFLWARSAAWRIEKPIPQFSGEDAVPIAATAGETLRIGFLAAVTLFAWMLVAAVVQAMLGLLPAGLGVAGGIVGAIIAAFLLVIALVAALRAAIYSSMKPGFQVGTAFAMAGHAPLRLCRVAVFVVLALVLLAVVALAILSPLVYAAASALGLIPQIPFGIGRASVALSALPLIALVITGVAFAAMYGLVLLGFMAAGLLGDWMADFDVASWGPSTDPLPFMTGSRPAPEPDAPVPPEATELQGE